MAPERAKLPSDYYENIYFVMKYAFICLLKIVFKYVERDYLDGAPKPAGLGAEGDGLCLKY